MNFESNLKVSHIKTLIIGTTAILIAIAIIQYPEDSFNASLRGLRIWWDIIFPALFPFLITAELLFGFGVVHFMGVLLEPLMKPLFNVPGVGGFVLAMGFASGYPMGAKLSARLREQNLISRVEGERLVSFTSTSDPLFLTGAIAVGFFHDPKLGATLAIIHYLSSIIVGLIMRFYKKNDAEPFVTKVEKNEHINIIFRAFRSMHRARMNEKRKFGKLMGDAVMSSIETLLMIGGFIMIFSVILTLLTKIQFTTTLANLISVIITPIGISADLSNSIIYGLFEVTLGAKAISEASMGIPFIQKIAIVGAISAWSGISVHAQVAAIIQRTDIRYTPYLLARILHMIIAFILTFILWKPLNLAESITTVPTFMYNNSFSYESIKLLDVFTVQSIFILIMISFLLFLSVGLSLVKKHTK